MAKKMGQRALRGPAAGVAAEPSGPAELLPRFERKLHGRQGLLGDLSGALRGQRTTAAAVCLAALLLLALAVYGAPGSRSTAQRLPRARQANLLEQQVPERAGQQAAAGPAISKAAQRGSRGGSRGGSTNCTVRLAEADLGLLRGEIERLSRALADDRAWPLGAPDATDAAELGDKVGGCGCMRGRLSGEAGCRGIRT